LIKFAVFDAFNIKGEKSHDLKGFGWSVKKYRKYLCFRK